MFRRTSKRPRDPNQLAHQIIQESVDDAEKPPAHGAGTWPARRRALARKSHEKGTV